MAGCVPCFIIPLLLFIFHRYLQPILLKFWNPWEKSINAEKKEPLSESDANGTVNHPETANGTVTTNRENEKLKSH